MEVLYGLSHFFIPSPFCSGYFEDRVTLFVQDGLDHDSPFLSQA
jgi:hypothetical protein